MTQLLNLLFGQRGCIGLNQLRELSQKSRLSLLSPAASADRSREVALEPDGCLIESPRGLEDIGLALEAALRHLPAEQREVIVLHVWGQMTFEEAAAALDISANTAASRYRYGLAKLKERLRPLQRSKHDLAG